VGVSEIVFFGEEFLKRREGGLEIVAFDGAAGLLEKIVERIADDAAGALCGRFSYGFVDGDCASSSAAAANGARKRMKQKRRI